MSKKYSYLKEMQEQLPSGADENAYVDFHKWTYRRWAWEFLRRNTDFQIACLAATSSQSKASVAEKYLLRRFKDCRDDYVAGEDPGIFRIAPIQHWMDLPQALLPIEVEQDDVLIRFRIPNGAPPEFVEKQLNRARRVLVARCTGQVDADGSDLSTDDTDLSLRGTNVHSGLFLEDLRVLDLRGQANPPTYWQCAGYLWNSHPDRIHSGKPDASSARDLSKKVETALKRANSRTLTGYLLFAARSGTPEKT